MDEQSKYELASGQELSEKMMEDIVKCLEDKDSNSVYSLFSEYTQDRAEDLNSQIEKFIDFYEGDFLEFYGDASESKSRRSGQITKFELKGLYFLSTNKEDYVIMFQYRAIDREDPSMRGLITLEITTQETYEQDNFSWNGPEPPGAYVISSEK